MRAAIVGLGWWGKVLVEAAGVSSALRFDRAVTLDPLGAAHFVAKNNLIVTDAYEDVLNDPRIDAVVLATPNSLHVEQILAAAAHGKHIYVEKPLALTIADADATIAACREAGVVLAVGHDKRFLPAVQQLISLLDQGRLGSVLHLEAQYSNDNSSKDLSGSWRDQREEAPGGGLTGPGLHALDILVTVGGPVVAATAQLRQHTLPPRPADALSALLSFDSGVSGVLSSVRATPNYFRVQVAGTEGWAEIRDFGLLIHQPTDAPRVLHSYTTGEVAVGYLLDRFAEAAGGGRSFPVSVSSARNTVAAFELLVDALERPDWLSAPTNATQGIA